MSTASSVAEVMRGTALSYLSPVAPTLQGECCWPILLAQLLCVGFLHMVDAVSDLLSCDRTAEFSSPGLPKLLAPQTDLEILCCAEKCETEIKDLPWRMTAILATMGLERFLPGKASKRFNSPWNYRYFRNGKKSVGDADPPLANDDVIMLEMCYPHFSCSNNTVS